MSRNIFRDGQTKRGYIMATERLHDELRFEYRPMLTEEVEALEDAADKKRTVQNGVHLVTAAVAQRLVSWSEVDDDGKPIAISFENVRRLGYVVLNRLYRIVAGMAATDPDPLATMEEQSDFVADLVKNVAPLAKVEENAKN